MQEKDKRSFFERLTGTISVEEEEKGAFDAKDDPEEDFEFPKERAVLEKPNKNARYTLDEDADDNYVEEPLLKQELFSKESEDEEEDSESGELAVDVYEDDENIYVQSMIAGVDPSEIEVSIKRNSVHLKGNRVNPADIPNDDYFHKELYWGKFSRNIVLPEEIDPERSEALEKHGLLILRLPKLNRKETQRLEVRSID